MSLRQRLTRAMRDDSLYPSQQVVAAILEHHATLKSSQEKITSLRNDPTARGGFATAELTQDGARIATIVTVQIDQALPLYRLVRILRPEAVVEIGTGAGTSGAMILAALQDNGRGRLITHDGAPDMMNMSLRLFERIGARDLVDPVLGFFNDTVPKLATRTGRVDFAFIDDEHRAEATYRDMEAITPLMATPGAIVFDDLNWKGSHEAWNYIAQRPDCAFSATLDYRGAARLGLWAKGPREPGFEGIPGSIELAKPYALAPLWRPARRLFGKAQIA